MKIGEKETNKRMEERQVGKNEAASCWCSHLVTVILTVENQTPALLV